MTYRTVGTADEWTEALGPGYDSPVLGDPEQFHAAARLWNLAEEQANDVATELAGIQRETASIRFEGLSAKALARLIEQYDMPLRKLSYICRDVEGCLRTHEGELRALRDQAAMALNRSKTCWSDFRAAEIDSQGDSADVARIQQQLEQIKQLPCPDPATISEKTRELEVVRSNRDADLRELEDARKALESERAEWRRIRDSEEALNASTANSIANIDLGPLADPSFLERIWKQFKPFYDTLKRVAAGDLNALLWVLHDYLEWVSVALAIAAVVLFVVGATIPGLNLIVFAVAFSIFALKCYFYKTKSTNPRTGEQVSLGELIVSGAGVALAGVSAVKAVQGMTPGAKFFASVSRAGSKIATMEIVDTVWNGLDVRDYGLEALDQGLEALGLEPLELEDPRVVVVDAMVDAYHELGGRRPLLCPLRPVFADVNICIDVNVKVTS